MQQQQKRRQVLPPHDSSEQGDLQTDDNDDDDGGETHTTDWTTVSINEHQLLHLITEGEKKPAYFLNFSCTKALTTTSSLIGIVAASSNLIPNAADPTATRILDLFIGDNTTANRLHDHFHKLGNDCFKSHDFISSHKQPNNNIIRLKSKLKVGNSLNACSMVSISNSTQQVDIQPGDLVEVFLQLRMVSIAKSDQATQRFFMADLKSVLLLKRKNALPTSAQPQTSPTHDWASIMSSLH